MRAFVMVVFIFFFFSGVAQTQEYSEEQLNASLVQLNAIAAEKGKNSEDYFNHLYSVAYAHNSSRKYNEAEKFYSEALEISLKRYGSFAVSTFNIYKELTHATYKQQLFSAAQAHWQKARDIEAKMQYTKVGFINWSQPLVEYIAKAGNYGWAIEILRFSDRYRLKLGIKDDYNQYYDLWYTIDYSRKIKVYDSIHFFYEKLVVILPPVGHDQAYNLRDWASLAIARKDYAIFDKIEAACVLYLKWQEGASKKNLAYAEVLLAIGKLARANGQNERAMKSFVDVLALADENKTQFPKFYLNSLWYLVSHCNATLFYTPQTEKYVELFKAEYVKYEDNMEDYLVNMMEVISFYKNKLQLDKAFPLIDNAMQLVDRIRGKNSNEYVMLKTLKASLGDKSIKLSDAEQNTVLQALAMDKHLKEADELASNLQKGHYAGAITVFEGHSKMIGDYYLNKGDFAGFVLMYCGMSMCYRETGNLTKALDLLKVAASVTKEKLVDDVDSQYLVLVSEGEFYEVMGNDAEAEVKYLEAIKLLNNNQTSQNKEKNDAQYYQTVNKLASVYRHWGYYRDANVNFMTVASYYEKKEGAKSMNYAQAIASLGDVSEALNLLGRSEWYYRKALTIMKEKVGENNGQYIRASEQFGKVLVTLGKYNEAEKYQLASREFFLKALGNKSGNYLNTLSNLSFGYTLAGQFNKAAPLFKELVDNDLYRIKNFFPSLSENEKATFYRKTYANINAYNAFAMRHGAASTEEAGNMYNVQLSTKGLLFRSTNRVKETILQSNNDSLKATYNRWQQQKDLLARVYQMSDVQKKEAGLSENNVEEKTIELERKLTRQSELFSNLLITNPTWQTVQQKLAPGEAAIEMIRLIEPRYEYFFWKMGKGLGFDSLGNGLWNVMNIDCDKTPAYKAGVRTGDFIQSINGIWLTDKNFAQVGQLFDAEIVDLNMRRENGSTYKATIKNDSVFYIAMNRVTRYVALILTAETKAGPELVVFENGDEMEGRYARFYQNAIKQRLEDPYSFNQFWKPLQSKLRGVKKIYFSPDGAYNFINPSTLLNPYTKKYVLDETEVSIVGNTSDLISSKPKGSMKRATLIGFPEYNKKSGSISGKENLSSDVDYRAITADSSATRFMSGSVVMELPGTKTEVNTIETILKSGKFEIIKMMLGDATEEKIKAIRSPDVLHIATHGFFMNELSGMGEGARGITGITAKKLGENPLLRSGLLLAGSGETIAKGKDNNAKEDGILTAYEAMNLDLTNTELVVLSACETGLGQVKSGEGVYGLNRAFRAAGAKSVLMSLWKVDDTATQQLMTEFYSEWMKGSSKPLAFRKAQLRLREKYSDPYYWGAFVIVGD